MEKIKFSDFLELMKDKDQTVYVSYFGKEKLYVRDTFEATLERDVRITEVKTAECWKALVKLGECKDSYVEEIVSCKEDDKDSCGICVMLEY